MPVAITIFIGGRKIKLLYFDQIKNFLFHIFCYPGPVIACRHSIVSLRDDTIPKIRIPEDEGHCFCNTLGIVRSTEDSGSFVIQEVRNPPYRSSDDGHPSSHGFYERVSKPFRTGWPYEYITDREIF